MSPVDEYLELTWRFEALRKELFQKWKDLTEDEKNEAVMRWQASQQEKNGS